MRNSLKRSSKPSSYDSTNELKESATRCGGTKAKALNCFIIKALLPSSSVYHVRNPKFWNFLQMHWPKWKRQPLRMASGKFRHRELIAVISKSTIIVSGANSSSRSLIRSNTRLLIASSFRSRKQNIREVVLMTPPKMHVSCTAGNYRERNQTSQPQTN